MAQCKDGSTYLKTRLVYVDKKIDKSIYPEAEIRQKLANTRSWSVCKSWLDAKNNRFVYECAINANDTALRTIDFDEACKEFHWKKFDLIDNNQSLKWYHDPVWDKELDEINERVAKQLKMQEVKPEKILKVENRTGGNNWFS